MGSGLILLVIVGAWLAVLVPMGLRSSGGSDSLLPAGPREPLGAGEPGRVLSRRARAVPRPAVDPRTDPGTDPGTDPEPVGQPDPVPAVAVRREARTPAARRRRRVLGLLALLAVTVVVAALAGPEVLGPVAGGLGVLLLLLVVHLRRAAVQRRVQARAERRAREAARRAEEQRLAAEAEELAREQELARRRRHVPGIPSRMPPRPAPPVREELVEQVPPRRPALGAEWQPRPVPLPMYVRQAPERAAPVRAPRPVADPAAPAEPAPYEHRRVSGGW